MIGFLRDVFFGCGMVCVADAFRVSTGSGLPDDAWKALSYGIIFAIVSGVLGALDKSWRRPMSTSAIALANAQQEAAGLFRMFVYGRTLTEPEARFAFGKALVDTCQTSIEAERMVQKLAAYIDEKRSGKAALFAQIAEAQLGAVGIHAEHGSAMTAQPKRQQSAGGKG